MKNNQAWIQTFTGKKFYPLDPRPEDIDILDIAHGLSMICRFNGQCRSFYSVAEHSVLVSRHLEIELPAYFKRERVYRLLALLHDASEAYISDVGKPIKPELEGYHDIENNLMIAIYSALNINYKLNYWYIKQIDRNILIDEQQQLMPNPPDNWGHVGEPLGIEIQCWNPERAEFEFLKMFYSLYDGEV